MDCIPNVEKTACIHCGWRWTHREMAEWPRRNCPNIPDPRTPAQIEILAAYCRSTCRDYGEANAELGWQENCLHGCTMVVRKRENKPLLSQLWQRGRCPANRWPDV